MDSSRINEILELPPRSQNPRANGITHVLDKGIGLEAGAWKVIGEARESGTAGIFRSTGEVKADLIDEVVTQVGPENWIFEASQKSQQV